MNRITNLKWDKHINNITSKANQTLNFLRRNLKVNSQKIKDHAYKALVRPTLEYSSCIWDPSHTNQIKQIEKVQRRAARFTCNRYHNTSSVTDMLEDLDWPTLQVRRLKTRLIMFYKIIHFQVAIYPSDLLFHSDSPHYHTMEPTAIIYSYCRDSLELQRPTHCPSPHTYSHTYPKLEFIPVHSFNSLCNVLLTPLAHTHHFHPNFIVNNIIAHGR